MNSETMISVPVSPAAGSEMHLDLGSQLRSIREGKKLTLRSVANAVGVSASLLSQVETGKTQPSVSTLYALVNHLGVSLDGLMGQHRSSVAKSGLTALTPPNGSNGGNGVVQLSSDNPIIEMENGVTWERLADGGSDVADPLIVTYAPGGSSSVEGKLMRHAALEYGVIIEGQLVLKIDFEEHVMNPGDSFCFDANRPHMYQNRSNQVAKGIWFVIGRKEMAYKTLSDLGLSDLAEDRRIKSAVDVLNTMKTQRGV